MEGRYLHRQTLNNKPFRCSTIIVGCPCGHPVTLLGTTIASAIPRGVTITKLTKNSNYRCGDVVFAKCVPFEGSVLNKSRPIIFLGKEGGKVRYLKCTSQKAVNRDQQEIFDLLSAGLMKTTYVEPGVKWIDASHLEYRLGRLCKEDMEYLGLSKGSS